VLGAGVGLACEGYRFDCTDFWMHVTEVLIVYMYHITCRLDEVDFY